MILQLIQKKPIIHKNLENARTKARQSVRICMQLTTRLHSPKLRSRRKKEICFSILAVCFGKANRFLGTQALTICDLI
jgi:hypothetical protein